MNQNSQLELKNSSFCVRFDPATGGVTHLFLQADSHGMNWAQGEAQWGTPAPIPSAVHVSSDNSQSSCDGYSVRQVSFRDGCLRAVYQSNLVTVTALRDFSQMCIRDRCTGNQSGSGTVPGIRSETSGVCQLCPRH